MSRYRNERPIELSPPDTPVEIPSAFSSLAEDTALAELQTIRAHLAEDINAGRIPADARRGLFAHELRSGVNFVALAAGAEAAAADVLRRLGDQRARFLAILRADLAALASAEAVVERLQSLQSLGILAIPGAAQLLSESATELVPVIERLATEGAAQVVREAASQGVGIVQGTTPLDAITRHVNRLIANPNVDALRAVSEASLMTPRASTLDAALGLVDQAGRDLRPGPLETLGRQAAYGATNLGRASVPAEEAVEIYASELLDSNTCGWCRANDGRNYDTLAEAEADYPAGPYRLCDGGPACRGTLVRVYPTAAP